MIPLGDPLLNENHILEFDWAKPNELDLMKIYALKLMKF